jgi:hypothetical protein
LEEIDSKDLWTLEFGLTTIENAKLWKVLRLCNFKKTKLGENQDSTKLKGRMHKLEHGSC